MFLPTWSQLQVKLTPAGQLRAADPPRTSLDRSLPCLDAVPVIHTDVSPPFFYPKLPRNMRVNWVGVKLVHIGGNLYIAIWGLSPILTGLSHAAGGAWQPSWVHVYARSLFRVTVTVAATVAGQGHVERWATVWRRSATSPHGGWAACLALPSPSLSSLRPGRNFSMLSISETYYSIQVSMPVPLRNTSTFFIGNVKLRV